MYTVFYLFLAYVFTFLWESINLIGLKYITLLVRGNVVNFKSSFLPGFKTHFFDILLHAF